jgi:hypothetical protein
MNDLYSSYEKLLRSLPKEILNVEKKVRQKFVSPIDEKRKNDLLSFLNSEGELACKKLEKNCRADFKYLGKEKEFDDKISTSREKLQKNKDDQFQKLIEFLDTELSSGGEVKPEQLCSIYNINETFLHGLNIVPPLQVINKVISSVGDDPVLKSVVEQIRQGISDLVQSFKEEGSGSTSVKERKAKKLEVAKESLLIREVLLNLQILVEQLGLSSERRNIEIIGKVWVSLGDLMKQKAEWEPVRLKIKPLYDYMRENGN